MIGDMNEMAAVPSAAHAITAKTIPIMLSRPIRIDVRGVPYGGHHTVNLHEMTDVELGELVVRSERDEGWRWARSIARLLAGLPPRDWSDRTHFGERSIDDRVRGLQQAIGVTPSGVLDGETILALKRLGVVRE